MWAAIGCVRCLIDISYRANPRPPVSLSEDLPKRQLRKSIWWPLFLSIIGRSWRFWLHCGLCIGRQLSVTGGIAILRTPYRVYLFLVILLEHGKFYPSLCLCQKRMEFFIVNPLPGIQGWVRISLVNLIFRCESLTAKQWTIILRCIFSIVISIKMQCASTFCHTAQQVLSAEFSECGKNDLQQSGSHKCQIQIWYIHSPKMTRRERVPMPRYDWRNLYGQGT